MADKDLHLTTQYESNIDWADLARRIVYDRALELDARAKKMAPEEVYVVWYCFILGGWKALLSTTIPDGRYYEVTYNKDKNEAYVDTYVKTHNKVVNITKEKK